MDSEPNDNTNQLFKAKLCGAIRILLLTVGIVLAQYAGFIDSHTPLLLGLGIAAPSFLVIKTYECTSRWAFLLFLLSLSALLVSQRSVARAMLPDPAIAPYLRAIQSEEYDSLPYHHWRGPVESSKFFAVVGGELVSHPLRDGHGSQIVILSGRLRGVEIRTRLNLGALPWESLLSRGDTVRVECRFSILEPDASPFLESLRRQGISLTGEQCELLEHRENQGVFRRRDQFIEELILRFKGQDELGVLLASVLGVRGAVSRDAEELFRSSGTTHLVVVSGFHIGIISLVLQRFFEFFYRRSPVLVTLCPVQILSPIFALIGAFFYTLLTGSDLSAVRALVTAGILSLLAIVSRRGDPLRLVFIAALLMTLLFPGSLLEPGSQLTFAALLGLILGDGWYRRITAGEAEVHELFSSERWLIKRWLRKHLLRPLTGCIGAFVSTAPVVLYWFDGVAPLSWGINFIFIPVFTAVCIILAGGGVILLALGFPGGEFVTTLTLWITSQLIEALGSVTALTELLGLGVIESSPIVILFSLLLPTLGTALLFLPQKNSSVTLPPVDAQFAE